MADFKPAFTISDNQILFNLHKAALSKTKKMMNDKEVFTEGENSLVNTGCGKDIKDPKDAFSSKSNSYEVGVACYLDKLPGWKEVDVKDQVRHENAVSKIIGHNDSVLKKLKKQATNVIKSYMTVFSGSDNASKISESKVDMQICRSSDEARFINKDYTLGSVDKDKAAAVSSTGNTVEKRTASKSYHFALFKIAYTVGKTAKNGK